MAHGHHRPCSCWPDALTPCPPPPTFEKRHRTVTQSIFEPTDRFASRHNGPSEDEVDQMLQALGYDTLDALIEDTIPAAIRAKKPLDLPPAKTESQMLERAKDLASMNTPPRPFIGMGYHRTVTPPVIARNILENPAWYTQYTPYQPEIAQGRLEALLNYQTVVSDLTGLPIANASLLDEGTAAAEAMGLCVNQGQKGGVFLVDQGCHPQTIEVVKTRATPLGLTVRVQAIGPHTPIEGEVFGVLLAQISTGGRVRQDLAQVCQRVHAAGAMVVVVTDLLSLTLLQPPGECGADVVVGTSQRFGVPLGYGGPHAAFFATREEHKRKIPGRLVGVTRDSRGKSALRLALQTREQHIRRAKATSNICTSQVLLAVMASMYAVYHGPQGLRRIARRIHGLTQVLARVLEAAGVEVGPGPWFDTVSFACAGAERGEVLGRLAAAKMEVRALDDTHLSVTLDEATTNEEVQALAGALTGKAYALEDLETAANKATLEYDSGLARESAFLEHPVFQDHHSEHEMLRYMYRLQQKDLSLTTSMIPLGSCTMKLNATAEMLPISLPGFAQVHPFANPAHVQGYRQLTEELESWLAEITGLDRVSLQPNAGSQGEYAGLLAIAAYHESRQDTRRRVCLIPSSAHGTNPASAVMAGMQVVVVACDARGNIDLEDLRQKIQAHREDLAALMVTYPSTHGVFEEGIVEICQMIHDAGGQVYMDGANMNAQVGLCRPGDFGVDVCHLNLHKTFCIPHGGGGPGVGPIAVAGHLAQFLPSHPLKPGAVGAVSSAPWGSAGILPISWMYIGMMGPKGLTRATELAILNANYLAHTLKGHYDVLYTGKKGTVAHEFILDLRPIQAAVGITVADVAKRLMDYGFHAPTMSWPVVGSLMIEPTESESKAELDRFAHAMISIRQEIAQIEAGTYPRQDNPLVHAPHTADVLAVQSWDHAYSRQVAVFPAPWVEGAKFWPSCGRVDEAFGDRNLVCSCPPLSEYEGEAAGQGAGTFRS